MKILIIEDEKELSDSIVSYLSSEKYLCEQAFDFVYTHIKNLKFKLARAGCKDCIKNVYGTGYRWSEE